jgi:hypothetical protein
MCACDIYKGTERARWRGIVGNRKEEIITWSLPTSLEMLPDMY